MADTWGGSWGTSWGQSWGRLVTPTGLSRDGGSGRRKQFRNINDDPDAYSDFFKTIRDRNAPPVVIEQPIDFGPDPFEALLAEQNALQAALQAREGMIAIFEAQQRLAQAERAWQQFLDDDEDDLLLLIS